MKKVKIKDTVDIELPNGAIIVIRSMDFAKKAAKRVGISIDDALGDEKLLIEEFFNEWENNGCIERVRKAIYDQPRKTGIALENRADEKESTLARTTGAIPAEVSKSQAVF